MLLQRQSLVFMETIENLDPEEKDPAHGLTVKQAQSCCTLGKS